MDPGMFRGLDKVLYTVLVLIFIAAGCNGYLIGRCHVEVKATQADSGQSQDR